MTMLYVYGSPLILLPVAALIWAVVKKNEYYKFYLAGMALMVATLMLSSMAVVLWVGEGDGPVMTGFQVLVQAAFAEYGRYMVLRGMSRNRASWLDGPALGLGWGGIHSLINGVYLIYTLQNSSFYFFFYGTTYIRRLVLYTSIQFALLMVFQAALSTLVLYSVKRRAPGWTVLAGVFHFAAYFAADWLMAEAMYSAGFAVMGVSAAAVLLVCYLLRANHPGVAEPVEEEPVAQVFTTPPEGESGPRVGTGPVVVTTGQSGPVVVTTGENGPVVVTTGADRGEAGATVVSRPVTGFFRDENGDEVMPPPKWAVWTLVGCGIFVIACALALVGVGIWLDMYGFYIAALLTLALGVFIIWYARRSRFIFTESELIVQGVFTKRYNYQDMREGAEIKPPVENNSRLYFYTGDGKRHALSLMDAADGASFRTRLEERTRLTFTYDHSTSPFLRTFLIIMGAIAVVTVAAVVVFVSIV